MIGLEARVIACVGLCLVLLWLYKADRSPQSCLDEQWQEMVMAVFAYIYHQSFVVRQSHSVDMILNQILRNLTYEEQQALYMELGRRLYDRQLGLSYSSHFM